MKNKTPNWFLKPLNEMTEKQWEQLCDRCGLCCIYKIENQKGEFFLTDVACKYLDIQSISCQSYLDRSKNQSLCKVLTPDNIEENLSWLPETCAYRRRFKKLPLPDWHPLISKCSKSLSKAGIDIRNKVISENFLPEIDWEEHIVQNDYFFLKNSGYSS